MTPVNVAVWPRVTRAKTGLDWRVLQRTQEKRKQTENLNELQSSSHFKGTQRGNALWQKCKSERQFCLLGAEIIERSKGGREGGIFEVMSWKKVDGVITRNACG